MKQHSGRILGVAAALLMLVACQSPQEKEASFLAKGKQEFEKKNYAVAILHFKNAAAAQPRDAEPYYQLGLAHLAAKDPNSAGVFFKKATELDPKHAGAQLRLAELMSTSRNKEYVEEAQKRALAVLAERPDDLDVLNVLAVTGLKLGKPESAEAYLESALRKSPSHLRSSVALAQVRLARKDVAGAEEALKQACDKAPKSPEPRVYLGGFYLAQGKTAEAEQQFRQALSLDPRHGPALISLGTMQARAGQVDLAGQTFRQASTLADKQYRSVHAQFLFQSGKRDLALAEFEKLFAADPEDRGLRTELVRTYLALNRVGDAEKVLSAALKKNALDVDALMQRSRIYLSSGKYDEAQTDLDNVLHFRSNSAEAHYLLARVNQARGDSAVQKQELGNVLRLDPTFLAARIDMAKALFATQAAQAALQVLDEAPKDQLATVAVVLQKNWALLGLKRTADARKGIDSVLAVDRVPEALLQDAALKLNEKDVAGARASAEEALQKSPEDVRALSLIVQSYRVQNQLAAGVRKVREHALAQPKSAPVQQFFGQLLLAGGDKVGARQAFEAAKAAKPGFMDADLSLAEIDGLDGNIDAARQRLSAIVSAHPGNKVARVLWAQAELRAGNSAAAIEQYRKVVSLDDKNALALNALAYLLAESKRPDEALKYAQKAKELAPDSPAVDDTLGWTYYRKGLYSMAVVHLEGAARREGTAVREYHLAMAYLKSGDPQRGRQALDAALKLDPNLQEAKTARPDFGLTSN